MAQQISDNPYLKDLGLELLSMENGAAEVGIRLREEHMNSWQVMHGGIIMTLLDACICRYPHLRAISGVSQYPPHRI